MKIRAEFVFEDQDGKRHVLGIGVNAYKQDVGIEKYMQYFYSRLGEKLISEAKKKVGPEAYLVTHPDDAP